MFRYKMRFVVVLAAISLLSAGHPGSAGTPWPDGCQQQAGVVSAKTWHLEKGQDWRAVSAKGQDKYLLAVAQIKQLVNAGQSQTVQKALNQLKRDFPGIVGPDLDAFIEAEMLFSKGKFAKAVRSYDRLLAEYPESQLTEAALDRQFAIATAFLAGQKKTVLKVFKMKGYAEGVRIMERISDRAGNAPVGIKAAVAVAQSYERREKFAKAYHKWSEISSRWPTGQIGKDALLSMARCKHAAYRGPKYNAADLISAKSYYENFKSRYPRDAEEFDVGGRLKQINEQRAYKQFNIGKYYQRTGNKQSANFYYQMVIDNWPKSIAAKMAKTAIDDKKSSGKKEKKWKKNAIKKLEKLFL